MDDILCYHRAMTITTESFCQLLQQYLPSIVMTEVQQQRLAQFLALLDKWNRVYNLTAVTDPEQMVCRHILDSLSVLPYLATGSVLDIGSGAGLPGLPLAIMRPQSMMTLLDSNGKKSRFCQQVIAELDLNNVKVIQARVEDWQCDQRFDVIISRAFSSISDMLRLSKHLCHDNGEFLAMKATIPKQELAALPDCYCVQVKPLAVPNLAATRHLIIIRSSDSRLQQGEKHG